MRNKLLILISIAFFALLVAQLNAGGLPVTDVEFIRKMLLSFDADFNSFDRSELCDAFIYLIENDDNERVVLHAVARLWETRDERSVPYLIKYVDERPLDCLFGLGYFSTPESCGTLLAHMNDEDQFNRRFAAESLGMLDYTVSEEMWDLRDDVLAGLGERLELEEEKWVLPILQEASLTIEAQEFPEDENILSE